MANTFTINHVLSVELLARQWGNHPALHLLNTDVLMALIPSSLLTGLVGWTPSPYCSRPLDWLIRVRYVASASLEDHFWREEHNFIILNMTTKKVFSG
jgi:hypothetical protein